MEKTVFPKIRRLFKFTLLGCLLFVAFFAEAQTARITLDAKNVSLEQVMTNIKNQTRYLFINENIEGIGSQKVSISVSDKPVKEVLDQLFTPLNIGYRIDGTTIYIFKEATAKPVTLSGRVAGVNGEPVIGASVLVKGTTLGTSTDADGRFALQVPSPATKKQLEISFIGYEPVVLSVGNRTVFILRSKKQPRKSSRSWLLLLVLSVRRRR